MKKRLTFRLFALLTFALLSWSESFSQINADVEGTIRSSSGVPEIQLFDNFGGENRLEGRLRESNNLILLESYRGDLRFGAGDNGTAPARMTIAGDNGRVGIGTENPEANLHITDGTGGSSAAPSGFVTLNIEGSGNQYIEINPRNWGGLTFNDDNASIRAGYLYNVGLDRLSLRTGGVDSRLSVEENGLVGINDVAPSAMLHIKQFAGSSEEGFAIENDDDNDIWAWEIGANDLNLTFNGTSVGFWEDADGTYNPTSDRRVKNTIAGLQNGTLDQLMKLSPKSYFYNHDQAKDNKAIGFIAQEVDKVFPEAVRQMDDEDALYTVNYQEIGVYTVKAVQELNDKVDAQAAEINRLRSELDSRDHQIAELQSNIVARLTALEAGTEVK